MNMTIFEKTQADLSMRPRTWLVSGVAGFIGSNLLERLLKLDQVVVGLDNFATGYRRNLDEVRDLVSAEQWARFTFHEKDIRSLDDCRHAMAGVDLVLHQAALGSVPRSLNDPLATNAANIDGFLNMLVAAKEAGVERFVYAASSSTYGDHPALPKVEDRIGKPLSPYAVTKYVNELYAEVFANCYGMKATGLRYFNVFGPRQDPEGAYAAVIPKWTAAMLRNEAVQVNGDVETSRDFCFIENAVQANLLAALADTEADDDAGHEVFNVAVNGRTTLNELFAYLREALAEQGISYDKAPVYGDFRPGDVRHSQADIGKAADKLGYAPTHTVVKGIHQAMPWYIGQLRESYD